MVPVTHVNKTQGFIDVGILNFSFIADGLELFWRWMILSSLLIKNAKTIVTMDKKRNVYHNADLLIENGFITALGTNVSVPSQVDRIIDASNMIVYPGLINTHHHLYQVLTRNYPRVQQMELFDWLKTLYRLWRGLNDEMVYTSALVGLGELVKYGCTTCCDHHYVFPQGESFLIDRQIEAAREVGVRFYACRGSMSRGESDGGLPPDSLVQTTKEILADSERLIKTYHDPSPGSFVQIVLAPCSPFSVTTELLVESAALARQYNVRLHTHLAETLDEEAFCLELLGKRPLEYMESVGWLGEDVWYAHGIHFNSEEIDLLANTKTGVAHCPVSNEKLASGTAKIKEMLDKGVPVGLAVDGSASNDCSNLLAEIRSCFLIHRLNNSAEAPSGEDILALATNGSARLLGRNDLGSLEIGKAGDCFLLNVNRLEYAGTLDDPSALPAVVGINRPVDFTIVGGKVIFEKGILKGIDEEQVVAKANQMSLKLREYL